MTTEKTSSEEMKNVHRIENPELPETTTTFGSEIPNSVDERQNVVIGDSEHGSSRLEETGTGTIKEAKTRKMDMALVWIDLEMTGLDTNQHTIIEAACIITDSQMKKLEVGPEVIIHATETELSSMNDWCVKQHTESGLVDRVRASNIDMVEAEAQLLNFVKLHTKKRRASLAGNTIGMDKRFLEKYMPTLLDYLAYQVVDVTSVSELCRRWFPHQWERRPVKARTHRAAEDIRESIRELQYYRRVMFKRPNYNSEGGGGSGSRHQKNRRETSNKNA